MIKTIREQQREILETYKDNLFKMPFKDALNQALLALSHLQVSGMPVVECNGRADEDIPDNKEDAYNLGYESGQVDYKQKCQPIIAKLGIKAETLQGEIEEKDREIARLKAQPPENECYGDYEHTIFELEQKLSQSQAELKYNLELRKEATAERDALQREVERLKKELDACYDMSPIHQEVIDKYKQLQQENEELREALKQAKWLYDQLALSPLEAAAKYGDTYEPVTDEQCLEIRKMIEQALAKKE